MNTSFLGKALPGDGGRAFSAGLIDLATRPLEGSGDAGADFELSLGGNCNLKGMGRAYWELEMCNFLAIGDFERRLICSGDKDPLEILEAMSSCRHESLGGEGRRLWKSKLWFERGLFFVGDASLALRSMMFTVDEPF